MSHPPVIDAGPSLNFFSINKERLLINVLGPLSAPEAVQNEVLRKSEADQRFSAAGRVWRKLGPRFMQILPDDFTPELDGTIRRMTGQTLQQRRKRSKDLGETMVVAHAVLAAEGGADVTVLMDDSEGVRMATSEAGRLRRLRSATPAIGSIRLAGTLTVLERAALNGLITDKSNMRSIYTRLRALDDGLPPLAATGLMSAHLWS